MRVTDTPVIVAPVGIPLTVKLLGNAVLAVPQDKLMVPEVSVVELDAIPPDATNICAGPDEQILARDGVMVTGEGVV